MTDGPGENGNVKCRIFNVKFKILLHSRFHCTFWILHSCLHYITRKLIILLTYKSMKSEFSKKHRNYDLADRLVRFNTMIGQMAESVVKTNEGINIKNQIIRSSSSAALNYGEALVPESTADFIHKISICLKELMETRIALKIIISRNLCPTGEIINQCEKESSELVAIFIASVRTARKNAQSRS